MLSMDRSRIKIVLVHGVAANRLVMYPLARRLRKTGFSVKNWGYSSLWSPIKKHGDALANYLAKFDNDDRFDSIALVGHSMGCIVSRAAMLLSPSDKLNRAVFLAPPNQGSPVADVLSRWVGWLTPPSLELRTADDSFVNQLPRDIEIPLGIVAAKADWIVPLDSTFIPCQSDHTIVGGIHSALPWRRDVVSLVERFVFRKSFQLEETSHTINENQCEAT